MFDYPLDFAYGRRLDNIDYERMGVLDIWFIRDTIILLTSFDMEINKYFYRPDHEYCYSRVYEKYTSYMYNCIIRKEIKYNDGLSDDDRELNKAEGTIGFDLDQTCFYKKSILENLANNTKMFVAVDLLDQYLSGCSDHVIPIIYIFPDKTTSIKEDHVVQDIPNNILGDISDSISPVSSVGDVPITRQYRFEKTAQSWNIQFGDVVLNGLKHYTGMDYIRILLQNRYQDIGVLELQSMLNPDSITSSREKQFNDYTGSDEEEADALISDSSSSAVKMLESLSEDNRAKVNLYRNQRLECMADLEEAKLYSRLDEIDRLTELKNMLEDEIYGILKSRTGDTELDKNRKKVYKNIMDARENIHKAELSAGYEDAPIYSYLKKYIETVTTCKYNPLADDPIQWIL